MKNRISSIATMMLLAAWLPVHGQQASSQGTAQSKTEEKPGSEMKHACCCSGMKEGSHDHDKAATQDGKGMQSCAMKDGKTMGAGCCGSKETTSTAQGKKDETMMDCCKGEDVKMCAAKDDKSCCAGMKQAAGKGCCDGMKEQCPAHAHAK